MCGEEEEERLELRTKQAGGKDGVLGGRVGKMVSWGARKKGRKNHWRWCLDPRALFVGGGSRGRDVP